MHIIHLSSIIAIYLHLHPATATYCEPSLYVTTDGHPYLSQRYKEQRQTGKYKFCVIQHRNLYLGVIVRCDKSHSYPIELEQTGDRIIYVV